MRKSRAFAVLSVLCVSLVVFTGCSAVSLLNDVLSQTKQEMSYSNPTDKWRNENIYENEAQDDAITGLLSAADSGDKDAFVQMFAPVIADNVNFKLQLDRFFEVYPKGLSECELDEKPGSSSGSYRDGEVEKYKSVGYDCWLDGEWYHISLAFCFRNTSAPDEVGVTFFCIENLEANALDWEYGENDFLRCGIVDESQVTARLINGHGFVFEPTPERSITLEQMRTYLKKYDDFKSLSEAVGEPNARYQEGASRYVDYYYELTGSDGSPLYARIDSDIYGHIIDAYVCTDKETLYDVLLMDH